MHDLRFKLLLLWAATLGIQFEIAGLHLGVSDAFALPLGLVALWPALWKPIPRIVLWLAVFCGLFFTLGHLVAALNLGYLTKWALLQKDLGLVEMFLCVLAFPAICRSWQQFKSLAVALVAGGSLLNLLGFILIATGLGRFVLYDALRYVGFMADPNAWAGYLASIAMFQLCFLLFGGKHVLPIRPVFQWLNFCLLSFGVLASLSRGGIIAFLVGIICCLLFARWKQRIVLIGFATACSTAVFAFAGSDLGQHLSDPGGFSTRADLFKTSWELYTASPLSMMFGIGIGTFLERAPSLGLSNQVHNTYLWLLTDGGPLLLGCFSVILGITIANLLKGRSLSGFRAYSLAGFCAIAVCLTLFLSVDGMYQRQFWFLLGYASLLERLASTAITARIVSHALPCNQLS